MTSTQQWTAQVFQGKGLAGGIQYALGLQGISQNANAREVILSVLIAILNFLALAAVTVIIISGILLIISLGNEEALGKMKKTIQYTLLGLFVVLIARVIVGFITVYLASQVA